MLSHKNDYLIINIIRRIIEFEFIPHFFSTKNVNADFVRIRDFQKLKKHGKILQTPNFRTVFGVFIKCHNVLKCSFVHFFSFLSLSYILNPILQCGLRLLEKFLWHLHFSVQCLYANYWFSYFINDCQHGFMLFQQ